MYRFLVIDRLPPPVQTGRRVNRSCAGGFGLKTIDHQGPSLFNTYGLRKGCLYSSIPATGLVIAKHSNSMGVFQLSGISSSRKVSLLYFAKQNVLGRSNLPLCVMETALQNSLAVTPPN
jgi:hypothetical protein